MEYQRQISSHKRERSNNGDLSIPRKQSRSNHDETSVRSQSYDIALELENAENNDNRHQFNFQNHNTNRTSHSRPQFDPEMHSQKSRSPRSQFSHSSDGSISRKRQIKSNIALQNKKNKILQADLDIADYSNENSAALSLKAKKNVMTDEQASDIYDKLIQIQNSKDFQQKKTWSVQEYKLLEWAIKKYCRGTSKTPKQLNQDDWLQIAGFIPGKNETQCQLRLSQEKKETIKKSSWVLKEDEALIKIIREYGTKHWNQVAEMLNENLTELALKNPNQNKKPTVLRNGKQCRERWVNFLNPEIKKDPFSLEEDIQLLKKRIEIGNKWAEIIKQMPGRTENNVKNRFNMMFKTIKDEVAKNVVQIKDHDKDKGHEDNYYLEHLVKMKKKQLSDQIKAYSKNANIEETKKDVNNKKSEFDDFYESEASNINMDHSNRDSKEYIKMNRICSNSEKINHAIQILMDHIQLSQQNIVKRICKYIQEDINTVIRFSEQIYETFVKDPQQNAKFIKQIKEKSKINGHQMMPMEALFNELNHNSRTIDVTPQDYERKDISSAKVSNFGSVEQKHFVEVSTKEQLVILKNGAAFAASKDTEEFKEIQTFDQLLRAPFEPLSVSQSLITMSQKGGNAYADPNTVQAPIHQAQSMHPQKNQLYMPRQGSQKDRRQDSMKDCNSNISSNQQMEDMNQKNTKSLQSLSPGSNNNHRNIQQVNTNNIAKTQQNMNQPVYLIRQQQIPNYVQNVKVLQDNLPGQPDRGGIQQAHQLQRVFQEPQQPIYHPQFQQYLQNPTNLLNFQPRQQLTSSPVLLQNQQLQQQIASNKNQSVQKQSFQKYTNSVPILHQLDPSEAQTRQISRSMDVREQFQPQVQQVQQEVALAEQRSQPINLNNYKSQQPQSTPFQLLADKNASFAKLPTFRRIGGGTPENIPNRSSMITKTINLQSMLKKSMQGSDILQQVTNTNLLSDSNQQQNQQQSPIDSSKLSVTHQLNQVKGVTINSQMGGMSGFYKPQKPQLPQVPLQKPKPMQQTQGVFGQIVKNQNNQI